MSDWTQHIEYYKFTGPTIKLLELEPGTWAILDHEYNLVVVCPWAELSWRILEVQHPPQRERPKPVMPQDLVPEDLYKVRAERARAAVNISAEDLDL